MSTNLRKFIFFFVCLLPVLAMPMIDVGCFVFVYFIFIAIFTVLYPIQIASLEKEIHLKSIFQEKGMIYNLVKGRLFISIISLFSCLFGAFSLVIFIHQAWISSAYYYLIILSDIFIFLFLSEKINNLFKDKKEFTEKASILYKEKIVTFLNTSFLFVCWIVLEYFNAQSIISRDLDVIENANILLEKAINDIHHSCLFFTRLLRIIYVGNLLVSHIKTIGSLFYLPALIFTNSIFCFLCLTYYLKVINMLYIKRRSNL